jgi:DNA-binding FadR family transcriptional regulator
VRGEHAADRVFRDLATSILTRQLLPEQHLPPEREVANRFGVSRIIVRQAVHRLAGYELVRVHQGCPTVVLDPALGSQGQLAALDAALGASAAPSQDFLERHRYASAALLALAEERMTDVEIDALETLIDGFLLAGDGVERWRRFRRAYWMAIARGTRNHLCVRDARGYLQALDRYGPFRSSPGAPPLPPAMEDAPMTCSRLFKALIPLQRRRSGSATAYLAAVRKCGGP